MGRYDDIINLPHHVSDYYKPMPRANRAAQFAPFAALTGHEDAIAETIRITEKFKELSEQEKIRVSRKLRYALDKGCELVITYFIPDETKSGGAYRKVIGIIKKWDEYDKTIILKNGCTIPIEFICDIQIK